MKAKLDIVYKALVALVIVAGLSSCKKQKTDTPEDTRVNNVFIMYSAGFNSLTGYLQSDLNDLKSSQYVPKKSTGADVFVVFEHRSKLGFNNPVSPVLYRVYRNSRDQVVCDTLKKYSAVDDISADSKTVRDVLQTVKDAFPAKHYGMVVSSHASGWLPAGYYNDETEHTQSRTIAQQQTGTSGNYTYYEIDIKNFAEAFPMHMSYVLFDACLMGGVEVAYQLKDVTDVVGFSQTEVAAEGFNYSQLLSHLIDIDEPDPVLVCDDYFQQYAVIEDYYNRAATISAVDCTKLDELAQVCKDIFAAHHEALTSTMDASQVQAYFRHSKHYYYDLRDMIVHAGATEDELARLDEALSDCLLYKAATEAFMGLEINSYCGLSCYLPANGEEDLDEYYKTLAWNEATGLVE